MPRPRSQDGRYRVSTDPAHLPTPEIHAAVLDLEDLEPIAFCTSVADAATIVAALSADEVPSSGLHVWWFDVLTPSGLRVHWTVTSERSTAEQAYGDALAHVQREEGIAATLQTGAVSSTYLGTSAIPCAIRRVVGVCPPLRQLATA